MNRKPRPLKPRPTNRRNVSGVPEDAVRAVLDAATDPAKRAEAQHAATEWERKQIEAGANGEPEPPPGHEGQHIGVVIDAHDGRQGHLDRDADLTVMIAWLRLQIAAQQKAPRQRGRPVDYAGLLEVAESIAAAGVPFSATRGSLCEKAVIKTRLAKLGLNPATAGAWLAEWAHDKLRQLAAIPQESDPQPMDTSGPGWKPSPGWTSGMAEADSARLDAEFDRLYPGWRKG